MKLSVSFTECPRAFPVWAIIAIIMSAVLLIGFSALIGWKILDTMQQKRECARFNEERKKATWATVSYVSLRPKNLLMKYLIPVKERQSDI